MLRRHRCFTLKCCVWILALFIALEFGNTEDEFCSKERGESNCDTQNLYIEEANLETSTDQSPAETTTTTKTTTTSTTTQEPKKAEQYKDTDVAVFTVATDTSNHGFQRFLRSALVYGIDVEVLGTGKAWKGGDMKYPGGGQKINLLKEKVDLLMKSEKSKSKIVLFTDSYDVIYLGDLSQILQKFLAKENTKILFSAEPYCWPDANLVSKYPDTTAPNPYLNSGGFIGYLEEVSEMLNHAKVKDDEDDQLFYTKIYLNKLLREKLQIKLDHNSEIFQNLNGVLLSDVQLKVSNISQDWPYLENVATMQRPLILHGNGPSKLTLNHLGNYLAKAWSEKTGCAHCREKERELNENKLPIVMMAVFIEQPTPFLEEFLKQLLDTDYPKRNIHLLLRNNVEYHETEIEHFFLHNAKLYASAKRIKPSDFIPEAEARDIAKNRCINSDCDYLFMIDSVARIERNTLRNLLSSGYDVIAPMLVRPGQAWSNFWGAINPSGFYARSSDYMDIVYHVIRGIWNVPFISNCYIVKTSLLRSIPHAITYTQHGVDPDMVFCESMRKAGIFMHVSNELDYGHLVNPENYDISRTNPDIYQVIDNKLEWEERYLHEDYVSNFDENRQHLQPCPDVYWFPVMSRRFCVEWVEVMEAFGKWSDGSNQDNRLDSGYEAVPTRDIHMNQVGLERQWLHILKEYVRPLQEMVFIGYYHNPPVSIMNFVVRYRPDEQPSLRPHHDSSTYTINLALNTPKVDYEGGGCRFLRYNCSVQDTRQGWLLMHPGRLTHYHEGLQVTKGTRYIMISFVDP